MKNTDFKVLMISIFNAEALGTRQLFSALKSKGYNVKLLFFKAENLDKTYEHRQLDAFADKMELVSENEIQLLVEFIEQFKPDVISFSVVSPYFQLYKRLYQHIKAVSNSKIVVGGWQATLNPKETIQYADYICVGEGDLAFPELIKTLSENQSVNHIQNIWINNSRQITKNPVRSLLRNLNSMPDMVFDPSSTFYIENNRMVNGNPYAENQRYGIMAGRGCPYHCTYCSNNYMAKTLYPHQWGKVRYRNPENVLRELITMKGTFPNIRRVNFYDEVFLPSMNWLKEFLPLYKKRIGLPFYAMFYPGTCKEEHLAMLKDAGLAGVWLGVQSGSERVRKEIFKRYHSNKMVLEQAALFKKHEVSVRYDFIFDNPFESFDESLESIYLMLDLPEPFSLNLFSLKYFPNTEITRMAIDAGYVTQEVLDDQKDCDQHNYFIRQTNDNSPQNFINTLAMYISLLANRGWVQFNREIIFHLIGKYHRDKNIQPVKNLVASMFKSTGDPK